MESLALTRGQYSGHIDLFNDFDGFIATATKYSVNDANPGFHYHENTVISLILQGGNVESRKNKNFERLAGDVAFFAAGEWHQTLPGAPVSRNLNLELTDLFFKSYDIELRQLDNAINRLAGAKLLMLRMYNDLLSADELSNTSVLISLLEMVSTTKALTAKAVPPWVNRLKELLHDEQEHSFTLDELARILGVHQVTISKNFTRYFGCTFGGYLRKLKVERSIGMIKNTRRPLTDIAFACGFADQSHFIRSFKSFTGFVPGAFRGL